MAEDFNIDTLVQQGHNQLDRGQNQAALETFQQAHLLDSQNPQVLYGLGLTYYRLKEYQAAINHLNRALEIKPTYILTLTRRGLAYQALKQEQSATIDFEKAISIEPQNDEDWRGRGIALDELKRYEEAIASYDRTLQLNPNNDYAWNGRGNSLDHLGKYEEAIDSYDRALAINPNNDVYWNNRGISLAHLRKYEEAIICFDRALQLNPNDDDCWNNWVIVLKKLGNYKAAIIKFDDAIERLKQKLPDYQQAYGKLYWRKGNFQYDYGKRLIDSNTNIELNVRAPSIGNERNTQSSQTNQLDPFPHWLEARTSYENALNLLTFAQFPQQYLEVLQDLMKLCAYLGDNSTLEKELEKGTQSLEKLLRQCDNEYQKIALARKFPVFDQLRVDILTQSEDEQKKIKALELAEKRKNICLSWMWKGWNFPSPNYQKIQELLNPKTAIIYWHVSPNAIATFILRYKQPLIIQTLKPITQKKYLGLISQSIIPEQSAYLAAIEQLEKFETWLKNWKEDYQSYSQASTEKENHPWRNKMKSRLDELAIILNIKKIIANLTDITHLILIPHRDLHLLPLHYLFNHYDQKDPEQEARFTITYLPSALLGLNLQTPQSVNLLVNVDNPDHYLHFVRITAIAISWLYRDRQQLAFEPMTKDGLIQTLQNNRCTFHFNGHAYHDNEDPTKSALILAKNQELTLADIFNNLDFTNQDLVCLSACETGITSPNNNIDEYIGLVSGFLAKGANYVISTLWVVNEFSTTLLIIKFYELFKTGEIPAVALKKSQHWLRQLTNRELAEWAENLAQELAKWDLNLAKQQVRGIRHGIEYLKTLAQVIKNDTITMGVNECPFEHPYHWAGFILTGKYSKS